MAMDPKKKAALMRRLHHGGKKPPAKATAASSKGFNPPWLKNGMDNGKVDPVPADVRARLAKKYGHGKKKVKK